MPPTAPAARPSLTDFVFERCLTEEVNAGGRVEDAQFGRRPPSPLGFESRPSRRAVLMMTDTEWQGEMQSPDLDADDEVRRGGMGSGRDLMGTW